MGTKEIEGQKSVNGMLRKRHRRQVGTVAWVFESHLNILGELDRIRRMDDVEPLEVIKNVKAIQRQINDNLRVGGKQLSTFDYLPEIASALKDAASRCDREDGIPEDLRENWREGIARLRKDGGVDSELSKLAKRLSPDEINAARAFYLQVAELGEPFIRGRLKETYIRMLGPIPPQKRKS